MGESVNSSPMFLFFPSVKAGTWDPSQKPPAPKIISPGLYLVLLDFPSWEGKYFTVLFLSLKIMSLAIVTSCCEYGCAKALAQSSPRPHLSFVSWLHSTCTFTHGIFHGFEKLPQEAVFWGYP